MGLEGYGGGYVDRSTGAPHRGRSTDQQTERADFTNFMPNWGHVSPSDLSEGRGRVDPQARPSLVFAIEGISVATSRGERITPVKIVWGDSAAPVPRNIREIRKHLSRQTSALAHFRDIHRGRTVKAYYNGQDVTQEIRELSRCAY